MSDCTVRKEINPLDCPFCGGEGVIVWKVETEKSHGECMECGARTRDYDTSEEAERAWNTRHEHICHDTVFHYDGFSCSECGYADRNLCDPNFCPKCGRRIES